MIALTLTQTKNVSTKKFGANGNNDDDDDAAVSCSGRR